MDNNQVLQYMFEKEREQYRVAKEKQKTIRFIAILLLIAACFYMYFVVPERSVTVDGNSRATINTVDNGSTVWQSDIQNDVP